MIEPEFFNLIEHDQIMLERQPLEKAAQSKQLMAFRHEGFWQCGHKKGSSIVGRSMGRALPGAQIGKPNYMRILVGGFGYLGANLSEYLSSKGTSCCFGLSKRTESPNWLPQAEVVRTLWTDEIALRKMCQGVDVIVHAAGMNAQDCSNDPVSALEFNGLSTVRLLQSAIHADIRRFIYLSTAHVYSSHLKE